MVVDRSVVVLGIYGYMRRSRARRSPQKGSTVTESNQVDELLEDDAMTAASHRNRIDVLEKSEKEARALFLAFDTDGSGSLDPTEVHVGLSKYG